jgi:hypothetical protein
MQGALLFFHAGSYTLQRHQINHLKHAMMAAFVGIGDDCDNKLLHSSKMLLTAFLLMIAALH